MVFSLLQLFNVFAWILTLGTMATVIFSNYPLVQVDSKATPIVYGLYDTLSRLTWAIALCYLIFACVHGYGGPINWFLSHPLWQPLSRLSYSIYLVHFPVIMITTATMKSSLYFSEFNAVSVAYLALKSMQTLNEFVCFSVSCFPRKLCDFCVCGRYRNANV